MPAVRLLGGASLSVENSAAAGPATQRHRLALLTLLALSHPRSVSRDRLAAYLWPDRDAEHARNLLKQGVHALRRALGARAIRSAGDELSLDADIVECDAIAFQAALVSGELERAVDLYGGPLLDGFHLPHASEFEQRIDGDRTRLRRSFVQALEGLADQAAARGDWPGAVHRLRRVAAEEPHNALITMRLMEALEAIGDRGGAIRQARLHAQLLHDEFDARADDRVLALAERLRIDTATRVERSADQARSAPSPGYPLVGRAAELRRLRDVRVLSARGRSHFALITGEGGIGKTRLAEELLQDARREGIGVARSRSYAAEGQLAYAPVADWLRSPALRPALVALDVESLIEVARLVPEVRALRPDLAAPEPLHESWQRQRLFTGIARAITARRESLILLVDDLQWCDHDTLQFLHYLIRFDTEARLLVIGTARVEEVSADHPLRTLLHDLRRHDQLTEIALGPLGAEETVTLASHVAGHELGADAARLYVETEGHPLFVVESVRAGVLDAAPPRTRAIIESRLAQLSPPAQKLVGVAATIGRDFSLDVLRRACEEDDATSLDSLDELWERRIIREHGDGGFDFSHDKLREVAYAGLGPVRRSVLHRRVAEALRLHHATDLDPVSGRIAGHYERGGLPEMAIPFYQRAAEIAKAMFANEEAIAYLDRALALLATAPMDAQRDRRELPLRIAMLPPLRAARGWAAQELGETAVSARSLGDRVGAESERLRATFEVVSFQLVRGTDLHAALRTAEEGLELALTQNDPSLLIPAHHLLGITLCQRAEFARAREHLEQASALYDRRYHDSHVRLLGADFGVFSHAVAAHALWHLGYADQATRASRNALELAEDLGHPFSRAIAMAYDAMLHQFLGDREAVAERASAVIAISSKQGFAYYHAWGTILLGWAVADGRDVERGLALMREGMVAIRATGAELRRSYYASLLAEVYGASAQVECGLTLLEEGLAIADRTGEQWKSAELHRLIGELSLAQGGHEREAEESLHRARTIARRQEARMLELRSTVSLARLLQRQRRREEALRTLEQSYAWFAEGSDRADPLRAGALVAELS